ncbi:MAG: choice-of-anchor Q domain-containing protein [Pseudobdellovibrionaceae bacterium]
MKRSTRAAILIGSMGLGLTLSYNACNKPAQFIEVGPVLQNTVAGNPLVTRKIATSICEVVSRCHPSVTVSQCQQNILSTTGFYAPLKIPSAYKTLSSIILAEDSGTLVGSGSGADSCSQSLSQLSCSDPLVQAAYDPSSAEPYAGSPNLLSGQSCGQAISPAVKYACSARVFLQGQANPPQAPSVATAGMSYSISPALPDGLSLNSSTGEISGTPTVSTSRTTYTITATGGAAPITNNLQIQTGSGFLVNDLGDASNMGGTTCRTSSGTCTLRAAISAANASSTPKLIVAPAGNISLTSRTRLSITKGMEIFGDCENKTVIDGLQATQIMSITAGPTLLENLVIQNGFTNGEAGAGIEVVRSTVPITATMKSLIIQNNKISGGGSSGLANGAGIAVFGQAGAQATLDLSDSIIQNNETINANFGGGLSLWLYTQATITRCAFIGNKASGPGAGISSHSGNLNISQTLFANNTSGSNGGGLYVDQTASSNATLSNVTFASNSANAGGGIYHGAQRMAITHATFFNNVASSSWYPGAIAVQSTNVTLENSIFSNNRSAGVLAHCKGSAAQPITSLGHNLSDSAANDCNLSGVADQIGKDAQLAALQDNGGLSMTMALLPTSPAINQGNPLTCAAEDQRGVPRLVDGKCDIGAFEVQ